MNRSPWPAGLRPVRVSGGADTATLLDQRSVDDIFGRLVRDQLASRQRPGVREERTAGRITARAADDEGTSTLTLDGYATTFDDPYPMYGGAESDWGWDEEIDAGAVTKSLSDGADVRLLVNHTGLPLARTKSGTLELTADATGLAVLAPDLDRTDPDVLALEPKLRRGDVDQMSWAFEVIRQEWDKDLRHRRILEARIFDVAVVTFPANENTTVGLRALRSLDLPIADAHVERLAAVFAELREGKTLSAASREVIESARDQARSAADVLDELLDAATNRSADPGADEARLREAEALRRRHQLQRARFAGR